MNALQSLTGGPTAGAAGLGLPTRGPGQALGGMGGLGAMGQPMPLSGQPPPGTSGMAPHNMAVVSTAAPQSEYTGGAGDTQPLPPGGGGPQPWGCALSQGSCPTRSGGSSALQDWPGPRPRRVGREAALCSWPLWELQRNRARVPPPAPTVTPWPCPQSLRRAVRSGRLHSDALWACTCVARGGLIRCGRESAHGASPPAGRPGFAL